MYDITTTYYQYYDSINMQLSYSNINYANNSIDYLLLLNTNTYT